MVHGPRDQLKIKGNISGKKAAFGEIIKFQRALHYYLYSADFAVCQSYFDSMGMSWAAGEDFFDYALG